MNRYMFRPVDRQTYIDSYIYIEHHRGVIIIIIIMRIKA